MLIPLLNYTARNKKENKEVEESKNIGQWRLSNFVNMQMNN